MDWYSWKQSASTTTPTRLVFTVPGSLEVLQSFSFQLLTVRKSQTCRCRDTLQNVASISNKLYLSNNGDRMETKQLNIHSSVNRTQISSDGTADSFQASGRSCQARSALRCLSCKTLTTKTAYRMKSFQCIWTIPTKKICHLDLQQPRPRPCYPSVGPPPISPLPTPDIHMRHFVSHRHISSCNKNKLKPSRALLV